MLTVIGIKINAPTMAENLDVFDFQRLLVNGTEADDYLAGVKALLTTTSPEGAVTC
jgi:hypothetical protein